MYDLSLGTVSSEFSTVTVCGVHGPKADRLTVSSALISPFVRRFFAAGAVATSGAAASD